MKRIITGSVLLFLMIAFVACTASNESANSGGNSNVQNPTIVERPLETAANSAVNTANTNPVVNMSANVGAVKNVNGMTIPANANVVVIKPKPGKPQALERPAPFDSVVSVELGEQAIERRTFKKHPSLSKIEKITVNPSKSDLKVYLKNGQTIDLPSDTIENAMSASPDDILKAANAERSDAAPKSIAPKSNDKSAAPANSRVEETKKPE